MEINQIHDDFEIVIDIDTFWFPGKPFGILKLIGLKDGKKLKKFWKCLSESTISFIEIKRKKDKNSFNEYSLELEIEFIIEPMKELKFICKNFWLDRTENYKKYKHANFS